MSLQYIHSLCAVAAASAAVDDNDDEDHHDDDADDVVDVSSGYCAFLYLSVSFYIISHPFLTWIKVIAHHESSCDIWYYNYIVVIFLRGALYIHMIYT